MKSARAFESNDIGPNVPGNKTVANVGLGTSTVDNQ